MSKAKSIWEEYGDRDPYFAVLTHDEFLLENIDSDTKQSFFESGQRHLDEIWPGLVDAAGSRYRPKTAVDFGCGVGRILIPLAKHCEKITGVDISQAMIAEARKNAELAGVTNAEFLGVDEFNTSDAGPFDLVHSYIVLQHIQPSDGYSTIATLARRMSVQGAGMIHVTYQATGTMLSRLRFRAYRDIPGFHRVTSSLFGRGLPFIPVYEYDLERVREILAENGCTVVKEKETDHGFLGKMFFISKVRR